MGEDSIGILAFGPSLDQVELGKCIHDIENIFASEVAKSVRFNLENVKTMERGALELLYNYLKKCRERGNEIILTNLHENVRNSIIQMGLNGEFSHFWH